MCLKIIYLIYMYKEDFALNNLQWLTKTNPNLAHSAGTVEYTDYISAEVLDPRPTSVLGMTLNSLMVRFQQCKSFRECGVLLHCSCSQVHCDPEW